MSPISPVLAERYAAPQSVEAYEPGHLQLPPRGRRIGAYLVDALLKTLAWFPLIWPLFISGLLLYPSKDSAYWQMATGRGLAWVLTAMVLLPLLYAVQFALLVSRGQTLGKMLFRLKIVKTDGSAIGFKTVVLREILFWGVFTVLVFLGALAFDTYSSNSKIDGIFQSASFFVMPIKNIVKLICLIQLCRTDRRTLPDKLAGTTVSVISPKQ